MTPRTAAKLAFYFAYVFVLWSVWEWTVLVVAEFLR